MFRFVSNREQLVVKTDNLFQGHHAGHCLMEDGLSKPHLAQSPSAVVQLLPHPARLGAGRTPAVKRMRLLLPGKDRPASAGVQGVCRELRAGRAGRRGPREGCSSPGPGPRTGGAETRTVQCQETRSEPRQWHEEAVEVGRCKAQGGSRGPFRWSTEAAPVMERRGRDGGQGHCLLLL